MTILIAFQTSGYRTFKHFYLYLLAHLLAGLIAYTKKPKLPSLNLQRTVIDTNIILA